MNVEFIEAIKLLEKERGIDAEVLFSAIEEALVSAYKREVPSARNNENISGVVDRETGEMWVEVMKEIVEEVEDPDSQIALEEAVAYNPDFEPGDYIAMVVNKDQFGRLAAQTAKSVINQRLSEAESERIHNEFSSRVGQLAYGVVQRRDRREVIVDIGRAEAVLLRNEQSRLDSYEFNQRMRFYILKVDERRSHPVIYVSRSHPNLVRRLFEQEVPEIGSGIVEIVEVSREAGSRSKIAVCSKDPNVDAVGSCVGQRGIRVQAVIDELHGEKIDIIEWDPDIVNFLSNALSPAKVVRVDLFDEDKAARVVVPDHQLSLAIGREGQNARLAARLTGWKIDIKSESQYHDLIQEQLMRRFDAAMLEAGADNESAENAEATQQENAEPAKEVTAKQAELGSDEAEQPQVETAQVEGTEAEAISERPETPAATEDQP